MELRKIVDSVHQLKELSELKLKPLKAYEVIGFVRSVDEELKSYDKVRTEAITKHGKADSKGNITVTEANQEKYQIEMKDLLDKEIKIIIPKLKIADLGDNDVSPALLGLDWLITK